MQIPLNSLTTMKLRRNTLEPLSFDPAGAYHEKHGVSKHDVLTLAEQLEAVRDEMIAAEIETSERQPAVSEAMKLREAGFYTLPERLLSEYEKDRQRSELGRLFKIATRMHSVVDRVVVLGNGDDCTIARALMDCCCQPYWNELSRGARGSKPRMYFEGNNVDNDAIQGLLYLLGVHESKIAADEADRWGLIAISKSGETLETAIAFRQFLAALERSCGDDRVSANKLLVPVTEVDSTLHKIALELGCQEVFLVPADIAGCCTVLSAVGLVPAAMLGINVIELLQGAVAMNDHFARKSAEENIILQYVAVNHLLQKRRGVHIRVMSVWGKALESVGSWYDQLSTQILGKNEMGFTPVTVVNTRDLHSRHQQHRYGARDKVVNNLIVKNYRFDALSIGSAAIDDDALNAIDNKTFPEVMEAAIQATNEGLKADGRPTTNLFLPRLDELHLGQLFQMLMIATSLERRLLEFRP